MFTIKGEVQCENCGEDIKLEFFPNGILKAVDDRDYYTLPVDNEFSFSVIYQTNCGHEFWWHQDEQEPIYQMLTYLTNFIPGDTIYGYLMHGPDGHVSEVVTV